MQISEIKEMKLGPAIDLLDAYGAPMLTLTFAARKDAEDAHLILEQLSRIVVDVGLPQGGDATVIA